jgi:hypothetical protein
MKNKTNRVKSPEFRLCQEILQCDDVKCETTKIEAFIELPEIREILNKYSKEVLKQWNQYSIAVNNELAEELKEGSTESLVPTPVSESVFPSSNKLNDEFFGGSSSKSTVTSETVPSNKPDDIQRKSNVHQPSASILQLSKPDLTSEMTQDREYLEQTSAAVAEKQPFQKTASSAGEVRRDMFTNPSKTSHVSQVCFKLPNATVGKDYEEILDIESRVNVEVSHIDGLDELGLRYIKSQKRVQGRPSKAGEYPISVYYHFSESKYQRRAQQQTLNLVINNDPKTLWKNIPSDQNMKFWKPDEDKQERAGQEGWKLVGASKRGRSHAHDGTCRDDDFVIISPANKWHILAVSDGAGSSQYSREGAKIAVEQSTEILSSKLDEYNDDISRLILEWNNNRSSDKNTIAVQQILYKVFSQAIYESIKSIHKTAKENGCQYRDLYATLLIAAHKVVTGKHLVIAYWIGDGALALYKKYEYIKLLGESDSGEYAGQTRFLDNKAVNEQDIMSRIRFDCQNSMTALFLMTDGVTDPKFDTDNNLRLQNYWDQFWGEVQSKLSEKPDETAQNLLEWLDFWSPGNHDDRTLALIYHQESLYYE